MESLLVTLAEWPRWAIFALVGAHLGVLGAITGWGLEKLGFKAGRYIVILFFAATPVVAREEVLPVIVEAYSNKNLPVALDEYTTLTRVEVDGRKYIYHYDLLADADFNVETIKSEGIGELCEYWRSAFRDNDVTSAEYRYNYAKKTSSFWIEPKDCK